MGSEISDDCFSADYLLNYPQGKVSKIDDIDNLGLDNCHAKFLKRFGVKANLVVPITYIDRVWGLLIAHQCTRIRTWKEDEITLLCGLAEQVAIGIRQAELLQRVRTLNSDLERQVEERTSKLRQALVKEKELGEMKSRFVSMASHEFRTPLAIIQASSDLLKHYGHRISAQKRIDKLNKIQLEVRNMTELLEDVLTIGKIELGKLHLNPILMDLDKFCQESIEEYKSSISFGDQIQFSVQNRDGAGPENIFADPKLLRQVIINLLSNSIKYSNTSPKQVEMKLFYDLDSFDLEFIDHGIGIPLEDQSKIFESFYRAQNVGNIPGTGLGLAIAKASVELHRGKIKVASQVDVGTRITITIPYQ
jgi:signal transduction histidine kinase